MEDEQVVEETTDSPSEETNTEEVVEQQEKTVPYDRFQEVVKQKNQYKDLVDTMKTQPEQVKPDYSGETEDALKLVDERASNIVRREMSIAQRKMDLDNTINQNPDFFKYSDIIKSKIQENPNLAWSDAYKLAKYDTSTIEAEERGKQKAYIKQEEKKKAVVETATKTRQTPGSNEQINPLAKGPDGKYLYTSKELEDILPKSN